MSAGGAMRWRVVLELAGADGTRQMHEIDTGGRSPTGHTAATLGLGLAEGKAILAALQRHLVAAQVDEHCRNRRRCDRCGAQRPMKDLRPRRRICQVSRQPANLSQGSCVYWGLSPQNSGSEWRWDASGIAL